MRMSSTFEASKQHHRRSACENESVIKDLQSRVTELELIVRDVSNQNLNLVEMINTLSGMVRCTQKLAQSKEIIIVEKTEKSVHDGPVTVFSSEKLK